MTQTPAVHPTSILGKFWTAANILSVLRMALGIPVFIVLLQRGPGDHLVLLLVCIAIVTDWLDGKLARWSRTVSEWGKILDPLADKTTGALAILALTIRGDTVFTWWFLALLVVRDGLVVAGATQMSRRKGHVFMSLWSGKVAVATLALTVVAVVLQADPPYPEVLMWTSVALLVYSFLRYVVRYIHFLRSERRTAAREGESAAVLQVEET